MSVVAESTRSWLVAVVVMALGVGVLVGCSGGEPEPEVSPEPEREVPQVYRDQIDQMFAAGYLTEFEQDVLEDRWVTDEEYAQAREIVRACLEERDYVMVLEGTEAFVYPRPGGPADGEPAMSRALAECETGVIAHIEALYIEMQYNPHGWTTLEAWHACMERFDVEEGWGLTEEEILERMEEVDGFLWPCNWEAVTLALDGDWEYMHTVEVPPGREPFTPRPNEP